VDEEEPGAGARYLDRETDAIGSRDAHPSMLTRTRSSRHPVGVPFLGFL
jgi:hypothetical protein